MILRVSAILLCLAAAVAAQGQLSILARPEGLEFKGSPGVGPMTQTVAISSPGPSVLGAFTATASSNGGWLAVTPASGTGNSTLTVTATPGSLEMGQYSGTITVASTGFRSATIHVNMVLTAAGRDDNPGGGSGGGPQVVANPGALFFRSAPGGAAQTSDLRISGHGNRTLGAFTAAVSVRTPTGGTWLTVTPASGTGNSTLKVTATPGSLAAGLYTGTVTLSATGFRSNSVPVSLQIGTVTSGGVVTSALIVRPDHLKFTAVGGGAADRARTVQISNPAGDNFDWTATTAVATPAGGTWLKITPASGHGRGTLQVSVDPAGLSSGEYQGSITVTSGTMSAKVEVELDVQQPRAAKLVIAPKVFNFVPASGNTKTLKVMNAGGGILSWTAAASVNTPAGGTWLSISPTSGSSATGAPSENRAGDITVTVNPTGLATGEYSGKITVTAGAEKEEAQVYLRVGTGTGGAGGNTAVVVRPRGLAFTASGGTPSPASQDVSVTSATPGLNFTATTPTAWVAVTPASGAITTASKVTVSVKAAEIASFTAGVYHGTVEVKVTGAVQETHTVRVALKVFGPNDTARLNLVPGGMAFRATQGGSNPASQTVRVQAHGPGAAGIAFTTSVTTASGGNWLSVTPASGSASAATPASLTVSANITGLAAAVYHGTVVVTPAAASGAPPVQVHVTLVVARAGSESVLSAHAVSGRAEAAGGPLVAVFTSPSGDFISQEDLPLNISVTVLDSAGDPVLGAQVLVRSSNTEPDLVLTEAGNGEYFGTFRALSAGPLSLTAEARLDTAGVVQTSPSVMVSGDMESAQTARTVIFQDGAVSAASFAPSPTPIAPGSLLSLFGLEIAGAGGFASGSGNLPASLGGVSVTIGGFAAPLISATAGDTGDQINLQVPFELDGVAQADVVVNNNGAIGAPETIYFGLAPAIFTRDLSGAGAGAVLHSDFSAVDSARPAAAGETVLVYCTGLGPLKSALASGARPGAANEARAAISVSIGGQTAAVSYAGAAPGFAGLYQVNVVVPAGLAAGDQLVVITAGGTPATGRATISVR